MRNTMVPLRNFSSPTHTADLSQFHIWVGPKFGRLMRRQQQLDTNG